MAKLYRPIELFDGLPALCECVPEGWLIEAPDDKRWAELLPDSRRRVCLKRCDGLWVYGHGPSAEVALRDAATRARSSGAVTTTAPATTRTTWIVPQSWPGISSRWEFPDGWLLERHNDGKLAHHHDGRDPGREWWARLKRAKVVADGFGSSHDEAVARAILNARDIATADANGPNAGALPCHGQRAPAEPLPEKPVEHRFRPGPNQFHVSSQLREAGQASAVSQALSKREAERLTTYYWDPEGVDEP